MNFLQAVPVSVRTVIYVVSGFVVLIGSQLDLDVNTTFGRVGSIICSVAGVLSASLAVGNVHDKNVSTDTPDDN